MRRKEFLVLFRGGDCGLENLTESQNANYILKWNLFLNHLAIHGNLIGGLPLQAHGRTVNIDGVSNNVVINELGEAVGGYLIIKANDYSEAVTLLDKCPIYEFKGNAENS